MKKTILFACIFITTFFSLPSYSFEPQYSVHTSAKDIEFKKEKALDWYEDDVNNKKFYWYDANEHIDWLKNRALGWYEDQITKGKFYFVHSDKELEFTKNKALRWYERNSK